MIDIVGSNGERGLGVDGTSGRAHSSQRWAIVPRTTDKHDTVFTGQNLCLTYKFTVIVPASGFSITHVDHMATTLYCLDKTTDESRA